MNSFFVEPVTAIFCGFSSIPQLHIVHIKEQYKTLKEAMNDTVGVAVLAFFYEVTYLWL